MEHSLSTQPALARPLPERVAIHLCPPNGGGVDRFVRDLLRERPQDIVLHVSDRQTVVERPGSDPRFEVVRHEDLREVLVPLQDESRAIVHAHAASAAIRKAARACGADLDVLTLHDIGFCTAEEGPDERALRIAFARAARRLTAPSQFIADLAAVEANGALKCTVIENGVDALDATDAGLAGEQLPDGVFPVAVIGAIGPHKGLNRLHEVAHLLPDGMRVVLFGYTSEQLSPGWSVPGRLWVHGPFEPAGLPALVKAFGARMAFFPPGQPESYCYALSDAWLAGLPALGPAAGALKERIGRSGGGELYDPQMPAAELANLVARYASKPAPPGDVDRARRMLSSVRAMAQAYSDLYRVVDSPSRKADRPRAPAITDDAAVAMHLDSAFFRKELLRLQGDLAAAQSGQARLADELGHLHAQYTARGEWIDKLTQDVAAAHAAAVQAAEGQAAEASARAVTQAQLDELRAAYAALASRHEALRDRLLRPLKILPVSWRNAVIRLAKRLLG